MSEWSLSAKALWQAPLGWLAVSLLCGLCLLLIDQQTPRPYRRPLYATRWIVVPYLGLLAGGVSPRLMGLTGINWFASFGFGLVLIGSVLVVLVIVRSVLAFSLSPAAAPALPAAALPVRAPQTAQSSQRGDRSEHDATAFPFAFLDIGAEEFHLAFLRSTLWELLLVLPMTSAQAGYWAAWVALCLALPEALCYQASFAQRLYKGALLVTTTVLFIFTRNFWLSWLLHLLGWLLLAPAATRNKP